MAGSPALHPRLGTDSTPEWRTGVWPLSQDEHAHGQVKLSSQGRSSHSPAASPKPSRHSASESCRHLRDFHRQSIKPIAAGMTTRRSRQRGCARAETAQAIPRTRRRQCAVVEDLQANGSILSSNRNRARRRTAVSQDVGHTLTHGPREQLVDWWREPGPHDVYPCFGPNRHEQLCGSLDLRRERDRWFVVCDVEHVVQC